MKTKTNTKAANFVYTASCAQIRVAYIIAFGCDMPGDLPYSVAGRTAQETLAAKGHNNPELFARILAKLDVKKPYAEIAAEVMAG